MWYILNKNVVAETNSMSNKKYRNVSNCFTYQYTFLFSQYVSAASHSRLIVK